MGDLASAEEVLPPGLEDERSKCAARAILYVGYDRVNLANLLLLKGESAEAEKEYRDALKIYAATLPPDHQYVASAQTGLARALIELGRLDDAATAATRALTIWRTSLPADHPQIANVQAIRAGAGVARR